jgi:hypothetical protein
VLWAELVALVAVDPVPPLPHPAAKQATIDAIESNPSNGRRPE